MLFLLSHQIPDNLVAAPSFQTSLVAQTVKNLPAAWETWVQSLGWEDPLEESMAIHSSILAWRSLDRGAWWAIVHGVAKNWTQLSVHTSMLGN